MRLFITDGNIPSVMNGAFIQFVEQGGCVSPIRGSTSTGMIKLTRMNGTVLMINENFIACAEETPDTVITLQSGLKYFVSESIDQICEKIMDYEKEKKRQLNSVK